MDRGKSGKAKKAPARRPSAREWQVWAATSGGLGFAPKAPGTFGTLGGVVIAIALTQWAAGPYFLTTLLVCAVLLYWAGQALTPGIEARYGKDPGWFVLDEVVGYLITIAWVAPPSWLGIAMGFLVFRFFDVLKPFPIRRLEHVGGGHGIMLDDVMAGIYGLAVMVALRWLFPGDIANMWTLHPGQTLLGAWGGGS